MFVALGEKQRKNIKAAANRFGHGAILAENSVRIKLANKAFQD